MGAFKGGTFLSHLPPPPPQVSCLIKPLTNEQSSLEAWRAGCACSNSFDCVFLSVPAICLIDSLTANPLDVPTADCFVS